MTVLKRSLLFWAVLLNLTLQGCAHKLSASEGSTQTGKASWYGQRHHDKKTASGEPYNMDDFTAAHQTLPFGTIIEVKSVSTGQSVQVRINDRGRFTKGRIIDLSKAAAEKIGILRKGIDTVEITVISTPEQLPETTDKED